MSLDFLENLDAKFTKKDVLRFIFDFLHEEKLNRLKPLERYEKKEAFDSFQKEMEKYIKFDSIRLFADKESLESKEEIKLFAEIEKEGEKKQELIFAFAEYEKGLIISSDLFYMRKVISGEFEKSVSESFVKSKIVEDNRFDKSFLVGYNMIGENGDYKKLLAGFLDDSCRKQIKFAQEMLKSGNNNLPDWFIKAYGDFLYSVYSELYFEEEEIEKMLDSYGLYFCSLGDGFRCSFKSSLPKDLVFSEALVDESQKSKVLEVNGGYNFFFSIDNSYSFFDMYYEIISRISKPLIKLILEVEKNLPNSEVKVSSWIRMSNNFEKPSDVEDFLNYFIGLSGSSFTSRKISFKEDIKPILQSRLSFWKSESFEKDDFIWIFDFSEISNESVNPENAAQFLVRIFGNDWNKFSETKVFERNSLCETFSDTEVSEETKEVTGARKEDSRNVCFVTDDEKLLVGMKKTIENYLGSQESIKETFPSNNKFFFKISRLGEKIGDKLREKYDDCLKVCGKKCCEDMKKKVLNYEKNSEKYVKKIGNLSLALNAEQKDIDEKERIISSFELEVSNS